MSPVEGSRVVGSGGGPVTSETHAESSSHTYQHSACSSQPEEGSRGRYSSVAMFSRKLLLKYQLLLYIPIASKLYGIIYYSYSLVTIDNSWTGIAC